MPSGVSRTSAAYFLQTRPKHGDDYATSSIAMLYISHTGCQWRFLPVEFGPWTRVWSNFVGVEERNVEPSSHRSARLVAHGARRKDRDLDGRYRHAPRSRGFERRCDLSQPGRPLTVGPTAPNGSSASTSRACHSGVRVVPAATSEAVPSNRYSTTSPLGADERLELVLVDRALRSRRPSDSRTNSTTKFAEWDGTSPTQRARGQSLSSHPSRLARRGESLILVRSERSPATAQLALIRPHSLSASRRSSDVG